MELQVNLNTKTSLGCSYTGATEFMLGTIESQRRRDFKLTICPVKLGLISVAHLQLTDVYLKRTYEFEDIVQVYVVDDSYCDDEFFDVEKYVQYGIENLNLS